jgi:glycosyltransferase involved in cell wall biosynthesis
LERITELRPDVVHDHTTAFSIGAGALPCPVVVTAHGPAEGHLGRYLAAVGKWAALVSISRSQRASAPDLPWYATVHNGVPLAPIPFRESADDHVVFLGRMSPDKGAHVAIEVARAAGRRIRLAGKCSEPDERAYFDEQIAPHLGEGVEWLGELDAEAKYELLGGAACLLFPLQWQEPFGLVMIESMACGTPVLSLACGAVPEVVVDGVTGYVRDDPFDLVECLGDLDRISRLKCREHVAAEYSIESTARGYEQVYRSLLAGDDRSSLTAKGWLLDAVRDAAGDDRGTDARSA